MDDDLPYYVRLLGKPRLVLPYSMEVNDARFWRGGLNSIASFEEYTRRAFDCLHAERATVPKMMSVGLHCRVGGTAARSRALANFLAYARSRPGVLPVGWTSPDIGWSTSRRTGNADSRLARRDELELEGAGTSSSTTQGRTHFSHGRAKTTCSTDSIEPSALPGLGL